MFIYEKAFAMVHMPTEFFERGGEVSREWLDAPTHELIYSTYQYLGPELILDGFVDYLKDGRPEIKELERGEAKGLESLITSPHYEGSAVSRLLESPHGKARLIATCHKIPGYHARFVQLITISDTVAAARYVHLLMNGITQLINDQDGIEVFMEDDTPRHVTMDVIRGMIGWYQADMDDYGKRRVAKSN
jgi:hypothetical protein